MVFTAPHNTWRQKQEESERAATVVVLSVNDVYDMYPNEQGRGGASVLVPLVNACM